MRGEGSALLLRAFEGGAGAGARRALPVGSGWRPLGPNPDPSPIGVAHQAAHFDCARDVCRRLQGGVRGAERRDGGARAREQLAGAAAGHGAGHSLQVRGRIGLGRGRSLASKSVEVIDIVVAALAELEWVEMVFRDQKQNRRSARSRIPE